MSKSVGELSQINSFSEFPVPGAIRRVLSRSSSRGAPAAAGGPDSRPGTSFSQV